MQVVNRSELLFCCRKVPVYTKVLLGEKEAALLTHLIKLFSIFGDK